MKEEEKLSIFGKNRIVAEASEVKWINVNILPDLTKKKEKRQVGSHGLPIELNRESSGNRSSINVLYTHIDGLKNTNKKSTLMLKINEIKK